MKRLNSETFSWHSDSFHHVHSFKGKAHPGCGGEVLPETYLKNKLPRTLHFMYFLLFNITKNKISVGPTH